MWDGWTLTQRLPVISGAAHGGVQAEAVDVGAKMLLEVRIPGHGALYRQHLLASTRTERDADPSSSTSTSRRVSSFINRVMILCSTACSASSLGAGTSTNSGAPSVPRRYTPSSTRQ